ncbi:hypothetical protein H257_13461 [Aphanomyces astaci]|uniref:FAS1 domain-containing protein n=1 Tax=Aphanomyces astaci TaxID=112090 RepID=W4FX05_APHAT|nr:hypothetical protein H257_13461 [Aphanomyces astaci]ETV71334.1 hypothetical protein H257_13461 [Aphanomyces astaci]|eukprot:XP_009839274.1 hypothetical protein H257_13461 [Aphanomyces astaci]
MAKTAVVLFVAAVAAAIQDKITPSVVQWLQQSSTANVAVALYFDSYLDVHSSLNNHAKCFSIDNIGGFQCNDLAKEEICSIAALPEVREIVVIVPSDSDFTPKPADALTTTAATTNLCPLNIIPKHNTTAAAPTTTASQDKITPSVVQWLQQSSTANVAVALDLVSHVSGHTSLYNHAKCVTLDAVGGVFQCDALTKKDICSIAALPEVREIVVIVPSDSDFTPEPADALTTTAATTNICPLNIIPKHITAAATPSACDNPGR